MSSGFPPQGSGSFGEFNPYQSPNPQPGLSGQASGREAAIARLKAPAIILMVLGPLGMLLFAADGFFRVLNLQNNQAPVNGFDLDAPGVYFGVIAGLIVDCVGFVLQAVVILGAYHMLTLKNRALAFSAGVISCIPCLTACCVLGIPFGIWALVIINDSAVKQHFES